MILQVNQDEVAFHNQYSKEQLERLVAVGLYPPAIHYTVTYSRPPDFEHASLKVLKVIMTGTNKPQVTFPIAVYRVNGECKCFTSQVHVEALPSPGALPPFSFVMQSPRSVL